MACYSHDTDCRIYGTVRTEGRQKNDDEEVNETCVLRLRGGASSTKCDEIGGSIVMTVQVQNSAIPRHETVPSLATTDDDGIITPVARWRNRCGGMRSMFIERRIEWQRMMVVGGIVHWKESLMIRDNSNIRHLLRCIFQPEVTQLMSWGTIHIKYGTVWEIFLGIVRVMNTWHIWRAYNGRETPSDGPWRIFTDAHSFPN